MAQNSKKPVPTTAYFEEKAAAAVAAFEREVEGPFRARDFDKAAEKMLFALLADVLRHRFIFRAQATTLVNLFHAAIALAARLRICGSLAREGFSAKTLEEKLSVRASKYVECGVDSFSRDGVRVRGESNVDIALSWAGKRLWIWEDKLVVDSANKNSATGLSDRHGETDILRENNTCARISSVALHPEVSHRIETRRGVSRCEKETVVVRALARSSELKSRSRNIFMRDFWFEISPIVLSCQTRPERSQLASRKTHVCRPEKLSKLAASVWGAVKSDLRFALASILAFEASESKAPANWRQADPAYAGHPAKERIKAARVAAGLMPAQAAKLINCSARQWSAHEQGVLPMRLNDWTLFELLVAQIGTTQGAGQKERAPQGVEAKALASAAKPRLRSAKRAPATLSPKALSAGLSAGGLRVKTARPQRKSEKIAAI